MSGKRQKLPAKRSRASEAPTPTSDASRFVNASAADRFSTICKNRSFIKEKGFHHPDDFFRKTIEAKGWCALCQPPRPAAMSVVREFYANLASHVLKRVRVRGVLVDFSAESINSYYGLEHSPPGPFDQLREHPDYPGAPYSRVPLNVRHAELNWQGCHWKVIIFVPTHNSIRNM